MNRYMIEIIEKTSHFIVVDAEDEHDALILAEARIGECGQSSESEFVYLSPRLLGDD